VNNQEPLSAILADNRSAFAGLNSLPEKDWTDLLKLTSTLGVTPLVYRQLAMRTPDSQIPVETAVILRDAYYRCHAANAHLFNELARVLACFQQAAIPVIVLKGAYLADSVYQDVGLRPMDDVDILVARESAIRGVEILKAAGFAPYLDFTPEVELPLVKHMPPLQKDGIVIELHWDVTSPESSMRVDIPALWSRAVPFEKEHIRALALSQEDLLLHLCIHAAHHYFFEQLRSLCDIREVITSFGDQLSWDEVIVRAKGWHADHGVYLALRLTREILNAEVPVGVIQALCPQEIPPEVYDWASTRIFQTDQVLSDNFIVLMNGDTRKSRLRAFLDAMLPPPKLMSRLYGLTPGSRRVYLRYPGHWWNRMKRYGNRATRMLQGEARINENARIQQRLVEWLDQ